MYLSPWKFFRNQILLDYLGRWRNQSCQIFFQSVHSGVSGKGSNFAIFSANRRWPLQLLYYRTTVIKKWLFTRDLESDINVMTSLASLHGLGPFAWVFSIIYFTNAIVITCSTTEWIYRRYKIDLFVNVNFFCAQDLENVEKGCLMIAWSSFRHAIIAPSPVFLTLARMFSEFYILTIVFTIFKLFTETSSKSRWQSGNVCVVVKVRGVGAQLPGQP